MLKIDKAVKKLVVTGAKLLAIGMGAKVVYKVGKFMGGIEGAAKLFVDDSLYDSFSKARDAIHTAAYENIKIKTESEKGDEEENADYDESAEPTSEEA